MSSYVRRVDEGETDDPARGSVGRRAQGRRPSAGWARIGQPPLPRERPLGGPTHPRRREWRTRPHHDVKLVEQTGAILAGDKPGRLVLDFAGVLFIDFTGVVGLIKLRTLADTT